VVLLPAATPADCGETAMVKSGVALTTRLTAAVWFKLPLLPAIWRVEVPPGVEAVVVTVSVELPAPLIDVGLKLAVAPAGNPVRLSATVPLNPFTAVVDTV